MSKKLETVNDVIMIDGVSYKLERVDSDVAVSTSSTNYKQTSIIIPDGYNDILKAFARLLGVSRTKYIELALIRRLKGLEAINRAKKPTSLNRQQTPIRLPLPLYKKVKAKVDELKIPISFYICEAVFGWYGK